MKIYTLVGFGLLFLTLGCQSSTPPVIGAKGTDVALESAKIEGSVRTPDAQSHDEHAEDNAPRMALADAKKAYDADDAIFVDTRAANFFQNEHIKGAINIPSSEFENNYKDVPRNKTIIAYCS